MTGLVIAVVGAYGIHLVFTSFAFGWTGLGIGAPRPTHRRRTAAARLERWMGQAGIGDVRPVEFAGVSVIVAILGFAIGATMFGSVLAAAGVAAFCATTPVASYRLRRANRLAVAHDAWPHMIEEIRVLTGAAGRSSPQALLDVGLRGPVELRPAFEAAQREWLLTTDFERTVAVLEHLLADPTADATCETLLVAHEIGGADLDRRLAELAEDRRIDSLSRKDARAKQAGVRFARRVVIAVAGMSLGDGRAAYQQPTGQLLVAVGIALVAACWVWSARMLQLPRPERMETP